MDGVLRETEYGTFRLCEIGDLVYIRCETDTNVYGSIYNRWHFHNFVVNRERRQVGFGLAKFNNNVDQIHLTRIGLELADSITEEEHYAMRLELLESVVKTAMENEKKASKNVEKAVKERMKATERTNEALRAKNDFLQGIDVLSNT